VRVARSLFVVGFALAGVVCALVLFGGVATGRASVNATDPSPQTITCQADGTPCCEPQGVLCVTAPAQVVAGENVDYQVSVTNTSSQPISGGVYAQLGSSYEKFNFKNIAPGATQTGKVKWKAVAGTWSFGFYTHVTTWPGNEPWLTIIQTVS
jgi:hypothetical protein